MVNIPSGVRSSIKPLETNTVQAGNLVTGDADNGFARATQALWFKGTRNRMSESFNSPEEAPVLDNLESINSALSFTLPGTPALTNYGFPFLMSPQADRLAVDLMVAVDDPTMGWQFGVQAITMITSISTVTSQYRSPQYADNSGLWGKWATNRDTVSFMPGTVRLTLVPNIPADRWIELRFTAKQVVQTQTVDFSTPGDSYTRRAYILGFRVVDDKNEPSLT